MKTFIKNLPTQIASTFTIMLICFTTISFVRGMETIPLGRLIKLFGLSVIGGILIEFAFGPCVFKKISDFTRICIFIIPFCMVTFLFAILCQWITKLHAMETYIRFFWYVVYFPFLFVKWNTEYEEEITRKN